VLVISRKFPIFVKILFMAGLIVSLVVIAAVIAVLAYRNNQKKVDPTIDKVEQVAKNVVDDIKKV
jgi:hypothetical protein